MAWFAVTHGAPADILLPLAVRDNPFLHAPCHGDEKGLRVELRGIALNISCKNYPVTRTPAYLVKILLLSINLTNSLKSELTKVFVS